MKYLLSLVLLTSLFMYPNQSFALSCAELPPMEDSFDNFDAIIAAKVISIKQSNNTKKLEVETVKSFKRIDSKNLTIKEDFTWGTSEIGKTYLFFLNEDAFLWENPLCSPTTLYDSVKNEPVLQGKEITLIKKPEVKSNNAALLSDIKNNPVNALWVTLLILLVASSLIIHNTLRVRKNRKND